MMSTITSLPDQVSPPKSLSSHDQLPQEDGSQLAAQVGEAMAMLKTANRKGVGVPDDVVATIFAARMAQQQRAPIDAVMRTRFWNAYSILYNIIGPSSRARRKYLIVFYLTLLILLLTQCYFTVGAVTGEQIKRLDRELFTLTGQLAAVQGTAPIAGELQARAMQHADTQGVLQEQIRKLGAERVAYYALVESLMPSVDARVQEADAARSLQVATLALTLDFLAKYVLPALYGLLGASAFVLRQLSDEIGRLRFAHERQVQYSLRLNIGLLGGLAIGWFIDPTASGGLVASLSPLALAFVAGYGSDLLFALLDRVVTAFATPRDDAARTTVEERVGGLERVKDTRTEVRVADGDALAAADRAGAANDPRSGIEDRMGRPERDGAGGQAPVAAA